MRTSYASKAKRFDPTHGYEFVGPKAYVVSAVDRRSGTSDLPSFDGTDVLAPITKDALGSVGQSKLAGSEAIAKRLHYIPDFAPAE